jgi:uncharacterized membrane protein
MVSAPPDQIWEVVSDPERVLSFMSGVTRWEVASPQPTGLGARYRVLFRVGSAEIGGLVEVVEWSPGRELAWTSVTGIDQRARWRLRDRGAEGTRVEFRLAYGVAGSGVAGWLAERIAAPAVANHLRRSLRQLKRVVEYQQLRERAAASRSV